MRDVRGDRPESRKAAFCPALIAGDNDYPGTLRCEPLSCDLPDPRRGSSDDNDFPKHRYPLATSRRATDQRCLSPVYPISAAIRCTVEVPTPNSLAILRMPGRP